MKNISRVCPVCDQGRILKVRFKKNNDILFICDECESVWFSDSEIRYATFNYFHIYMERINSNDKWSEIDIL